MHDKTYELIQNSPQFVSLVRKRERFAWTLSAIMLGLYLLFILAIAFSPELLGQPIGDGPMTWGIPFGVGLICVAFALTGLYVLRANGEFDRLTHALLKEVQA